MMLNHWVRIMAAFLVALPIAAGQVEESPDVQFRAAMHKELVEGDLPGAIALYQKVAANPDAPRRTVARALLQVGLCYERLGDAQARPAYRKLIDGYPEQRRQVEVAKRRLAEMAKTSGAAAEIPAFQQIEMTARLYGPAALSPGGDCLAFTAEGSLWVVPVHGKVQPDIAGIPERLTVPMGAWGQLAWSQDGNWIAFNAERSDVYVIPSAGGEPTRVVAARFPGAGRDPWDYAISLSPDGSELAYGAGPDGEERVYVAPVAGGAAVPVSVEQSRQPAFSPDGRWIACVTESWTHRVEDGERKSTVRGALWIASSDGGDTVRLAEMSGCASRPVWSPDGRMIAYLHGDGMSAFTGELRILPVRDDGRPAAPSTKLELPFVTPELLTGWTARNEIGILKFMPGSSSIYKLAVDGGRAALICALDGAHPRWSPDGNKVYFRDRGHVFWIPAEGGEPTNVPIQAAKVVEAVPGGGNEPSPDGSRIVLAGYLKKPGPVSVNIWTVPSGGGVPRQITDFPSSAHARFPCWSPDGKSIAFVKIDEEKEGNIYIVPAEGGESLRVTSTEDKAAWARIAWSPGGNEIAYFSRGETLNLFHLPTGDSRVLVELEKVPGQQPAVPGGMSQIEMAWSPDGRRLVYTHNGGIWLVTLGNPDPIKVETGRAELSANYIDWSADGKWLVFTGNTGFDLQLNLMTDFMSLVTR